MVKFFPGAAKLMSSAKGSSKIFSGKRILLVGLPTILIIGLVLFVFANTTRSCGSLINNSTNTINHANGKKDYMATYQNLKKKESSCGARKGILGIGSKSNSTSDKLQQIQYYHEKATVGYRVGNFVQAKKDAESGLAIDNQLQKSEKTLKNYNQLIQDLKWVRDGTY
jgi:hypothetical protein